MNPKHRIMLESLYAIALSSLSIIIQSNIDCVVDIVWITVAMILALVIFLVLSDIVSVFHTTIENSPNKGHIKVISRLLQIEAYSFSLTLYPCISENATQLLTRVTFILSVAITAVIVHALLKQKISSKQSKDK